MQAYDLSPSSGLARRPVAPLPIPLALGSPAFGAFRSQTTWDGVTASAVGTSGGAALLIADGSGLSDAAVAAGDQARPDQPIGGLAKRFLDIFIASAALVVLLPMMLFLAILIRATTGASPIFAHERVGFGGRTFRCFKFRTMKLAADEILKQHLAANPRAAEEWMRTRKLMNDPRINCLGNVLRKSSIDELPQLFNVLKGDMSLVGPRPVVASEIELYGQRAKQYFAVRPGLTGLWQISGRSRVSYSTRVAMDYLYVRKWSLRLDLMILVKTIPAVTKIDETA